jgi:hypothetical protein
MVGAGALTSTGTYKLSMEIISAIAVLGFLASFFIYPATTDSVVALDSKAGGRSGCCSSTSPSGSAV